MKQIPAEWNSDRLFMSDLKESEIFVIHPLLIRVNTCRNGTDEILSQIM